MHYVYNNYYAMKYCCNVLATAAVVKTISRVGKLIIVDRD